MKRYKIWCDCGVLATIVEGDDGQWVAYHAAMIEINRRDAEIIRLEAEVERLKKQHYADLVRAAMKGE